MKKGYQDFVTIVSNRDKFGNISVIGILPDRFKATVIAFFKSIPSRLKQTVKTVCCDMYDGFVESAAEVFSSQVVVIDRYHVAKLYRAPLDQLRIKEMKRLKSELSELEYAKLDGMMWILRTHHECLTEVDRNKLSLLYKYSPKLKKAHSLALRLTQIFNTKCSRKSAVAKINRWIQKVEKGSHHYFATFIKALIKYRSGIANYFKARKNSGFVEGLNNKIKVAKRRCYGFLKPVSLFQRLQLDLSGAEYMTKQ